MSLKVTNNYDIGGHAMHYFAIHHPDKGYWTGNKFKGMNDMKLYKGYTTANSTINETIKDLDCNVIRFIAQPTEIIKSENLS